MRKTGLALLTIGGGIVAMALASKGFALSESPVAAASPAAKSANPPSTTIVPSDESGPAPAPIESGAASSPHTSSKRTSPHHKTSAATPPEVEPAAARLRVTQAGWIYATPSSKGKKLEKATVGKFVDVTGSTKYYLQAKLKNGQTGYISPSDVELVKPIDKIFMLTQDAAVLDAPNKWARKLSEVHRQHNVHAVGIALNYMRIRMKSGVTGFIPVSSLQ